MVESRTQQIKRPGLCDDHCFTPLPQKEGKKQLTNKQKYPQTLKQLNNNNKRTKAKNMAHKQQQNSRYKAYCKDEDFKTVGLSEYDHTF